MDKFIYIITKVVVIVTRLLGCGSGVETLLVHIVFFKPCRRAWINTSEKIILMLIQIQIQTQTLIQIKIQIQIEIQIQILIQIQIQRRG